MIIFSYVSVKWVSVKWMWAISCFESNPINWNYKTFNIIYLSKVILKGGGQIHLGRANSVVWCSHNVCTIGNLALGFKPSGQEVTKRSLSPIFVSYWFFIISKHNFKICLFNKITFSSFLELKRSQTTEPWAALATTGLAARSGLARLLSTLQVSSFSWLKIRLENEDNLHH